MTNQEKFDLCCQQAREIVARYRDGAPAGCDPQNSAVALATLVVGAGTAAYGAYSSNKKSKEAAAATAAGGFKPMKLPDMPKYIPYNSSQLQNDAIATDQAGYLNSDQDFQKRHAPLVSAEKLFEQQTLKDQQGDSQLMPQVQNEFMRAGLQGALSSFGSSTGTLAPGSAGEADVARNLGLSVMNFQDRNRQNRQQSLVTAEQLFPRRTFGLNGADVTQIGMANTAGQNNYNQAQYAANVQAKTGLNIAQTQSNNALSLAQGQADASKSQAIISAGELLAKLGTQYAATRSGTPATASTAAPAATWKAAA